MYSVVKSANIFANVQNQSHSQSHSALNLHTLYSLLKSIGCFWMAGTFVNAIWKDVRFDVVVVVINWNEQCASKLKLGKFIRFMWRFYVQQHSFGYLFTSFSHSLNILLISSFPSLRLKNVNTTVCKGQDASINFVRCMRLDIELQDKNNAKHSNTKQTYSQADQIMRWYLNSIKF